MDKVESNANYEFPTNPLLHCLPRFSCVSCVFGDRGAHSVRLPTVLHWPVAVCLRALTLCAPTPLPIHSTRLSLSPPLPRASTRVDDDTRHNTRTRIHPHTPTAHTVGTQPNTAHSQLSLARSSLVTRGSAVWLIRPHRSTTLDPPRHETQAAEQEGARVSCHHLRVTRRLHGAQRDRRLWPPALRVLRHRCLHCSCRQPLHPRRMAAVQAMATRQCCSSHK